MSIFDTPISTLSGEPTTLGALIPRAALLVNVASKCGLTPQYEGQGFTVIGFPCNQFMEQEPGSPEEIATFCSTTYGVTFPLTEKIEVNGENRHPIYQELCAVADGTDEAYSGDIRWNFEKFLVTKDGTTLRFTPITQPNDEKLVAAIEAALA